MVGDFFCSLGDPFGDAPEIVLLLLMFDTGRGGRLGLREEDATPVFLVWNSATARIKFIQCCRSFASDPESN